MKGMTVFGMPGTNKHAIAKMAAESMEKPQPRYVNTDQVMRENMQAAPLLIRVQHGIDTWRNLVRDCIMELPTDDKVIVPNDSIIFRQDALNKLFMETNTILLDIDPAIVFERLKSNRFIDENGRLQNVELLQFDVLYRRYMRSVARRVNSIINITDMDEYEAKDMLATIMQSQPDSKVA